MRAALVAFSAIALAAAVPAAAQPVNARERLGELERHHAAGAALDRQHDIEQQNQLNSLDANLRTQQALSQASLQPNLPAPVPPSYTRGTPAPVQGTPAAGAKGAADIPDALLQDSNERVREAAGNRH